MNLNCTLSNCTSCENIINFFNTVLLSDEDYVLWFTDLICHRYDDGNLNLDKTIMFYTFKITHFFIINKATQSFCLILPVLELVFLSEGQRD